MVHSFTVQLRLKSKYAMQPMSRSKNESNIPFGGIYIRAINMDGIEYRAPSIHQHSLIYVTESVETTPL